jgi:hypothetical protein
MYENEEPVRQVDETCASPMEQCTGTLKEYTPSRSEALRDYRIEIDFLTIGCIVKVGCKSIPFTSTDEAMKELNAYVKNPIEARKVWYKRFEDYDKQ